DRNVTGVQTCALPISEEAENSESGSQNASGLSEMFTDRDFQTDYDENSSIEILLEGDSAVSDSKSVQISDGMVQITEEGTYILRSEERRVGKGCWCGW